MVAVLKQGCMSVTGGAFSDYLCLVLTPRRWGVEGSGGLDKLQGVEVGKRLNLEKALSAI